MKTFSLPPLLYVVTTLAILAGCTKYPEVSTQESQTLIKGLYTACSSQSPERLAKVEAAWQKLDAAGKLTAAEKETFGRIIEKAKAGQWKAAEDESWAFAKAQVR